MKNYGNLPDFLPFGGFKKYRKGPIVMQETVFASWMVWKHLWKHLGSTGRVFAFWVGVAVQLSPAISSTAHPRCSALIEVKCLLAAAVEHYPC